MNTAVRSKSILASGVGVIAIKLANAFLGFVTVTVFARLLPPVDYGFYIMALTVAQFLALPLQMGLPILLKREIAIAVSTGEAGQARGIQIWTRKIVAIGTVLVGSLIIGIYAITLAAGWSYFQHVSWAVVLMVVTLIPVIAELKRAMETLTGFKKVTLGRVPDAIIRPVLLIVIGYTGLRFFEFDPQDLLATYLFSAAVAAGTAYILVRLVEVRVLPRETEPEYDQALWWRSAWPLTAVAAAMTVKTYSDILMLGAIGATESVAHYRVATQIAAIAMLVQVAVNAVLGPWVAGMYAKSDETGVQRLAVQGSRIAFGITLAFACCLYLLGEGRFVTLLGSEYSEVYELAVLLSFGLAATAFFGGTVLLLNMTRRESFSARYGVSTAIANILLNLALIPIYGAFGAAVATILTNLAMQVLSWQKLRRDTGIRSDAFAVIS